jgi:hypothetical protein
VIQDEVRLLHLAWSPDVLDPATQAHLSPPGRHLLCQVMVSSIPCL